MNSQQQKQLKKAIAESTDLFPDKVICHKDGRVTLKRGYFYRHGNTAAKWAEKCLPVVQSIVPEAKLDECYDDWAAWPKDSYFVAVFK